MPNSNITTHLNTFKEPFSFTNWKDLLNPSTIKINRRGPKGKPCLIPLKVLKKVEVTTLINTS